MNGIYLKLVALCFIMLPFAKLGAQCETENTYFQGGELLTYDLYFKYGILYTKAGHSEMSVTDDTYKGKDAYKLTLTARSTGAARSLFSLTDTLSAYITKKLVPLAYSKDAHEKGDYNTERATFDYSSGMPKVRNISKRNNKVRYDSTYVSKTCIYDMVSIVFYARTLNYESMKKGDRVTVTGLAGRSKTNMNIIYQGIETVKANDGREYYCIKLSLTVNDDAFDNEDEAMKVYFTNDFNRVPVRIDSKLKVGSTRVILKGYQGLRN